MADLPGKDPRPNDAIIADLRAGVVSSDAAEQRANAQFREAVSSLLSVSDLCHRQAAQFLRPGFPVDDPAGLRTSVPRDPEILREVEALISEVEALRNLGLKWQAIGQRLEETMTELLALHRNGFEGQQTVALRLARALELRTEHDGARPRKP